MASIWRPIFETVNTRLMWSRKREHGLQKLHWNHGIDGSIHGNETFLHGGEGIFRSREWKLENFFFSFRFCFPFLNRDREEESSHDFAAFLLRFLSTLQAAFFLIPLLHAPPIRFVSSEIKYTGEHPSSLHTLVTTPCYLLRLRPRWKCLFRRGGWKISK